MTKSAKQKAAPVPPPAPQALPLAKSKSRTLLKVPDVAALCECDQKTIHNWCDREPPAIAHLRTPGRQLRFRPADVIAFLESRGYDVPARLRVLAVDAAIARAPVADWTAEEEAAVEKVRNMKGEGR